MSDIKEQVAERLEAVSIGGDIRLATSQIHELYMKKLEEMLCGNIILKGHIEKETDFWTTVHCPESGMIIEIPKRDIAEIKANLKIET